MPKSNYNFDLDQLTKLLAVEMTARTGELWRAVINDELNWNHVESPTACLSLREHWQTKRLTIHATAPIGIREQTTGETITCDPKRTAEAIARDIENRILTHARTHLLESREYDQQRRRKEAEQRLRTNMLKRYTPKEYHEGRLTDGEGLWTRLSYDDNIQIEITVPLRRALQILKFIKGA